MIDFICDVMGYNLSGNSYNADSTVYAAAAMCVFVLFILAVYLLVRFLQWLWSVIK